MPNDLSTTSMRVFERLRRSVIHGLPESGETATVGGTADVDLLALGRQMVSSWECGSLEEPVTPQSVEARSGKDLGSDACLALLCCAGERAALLRFDSQSLRRWLNVHDRLLRHDGELELRRSLGHHWAALMAGCLDEASVGFEGERARARTLGVADGLVDVEAALALIHATRGELSDGVESARRASRMARTEALPNLELFANLILARVRRASGNPYLASTILDVLSKLAPPVFQGWLRWEQLLAGTSSHATALPAWPVSRAWNALNEALEHARRGAASPFDEAANRALRGVSDFVILSWELEDLLVCLDGRRATENATRACDEWVDGRESRVPWGFHNIVDFTKTDSEMSPSVGYVWLSPGRPARRVLGAGLGLVADDGAFVIERQVRPQERTQTGLAFMALCHQQQLDERLFFATLYGFPYDNVLHKHILDMLISRMRELVGSAAELRRGGGHLALEPTRTLLLWDPRSERPLEDQVLATIARGGGKTAKQTAAFMGVSLRTVQVILKDLTDAGGCVSRRQGRSVTYTVEDTTFSSPTTHRFRPKG